MNKFISKLFKKFQSRKTPKEETFDDIDLTPYNNTGICFGTSADYYVRDSKGHNLGKAFDMENHNGWGDTLSFLDWKTRRISGHGHGYSKHDFVISKMESGKTAILRIVDIKYCSNPNDQFFGTVKDIGYLPDDWKSQMKVET